MWQSMAIKSSATGNVSEKTTTLEEACFPPCQCLPIQRKIEIKLN